MAMRIKRQVQIMAPATERADAHVTPGPDISAPHPRASLKLPSALWWSPLPLAGLAVVLVTAVLGIGWPQAGIAAALMIIGAAWTWALHGMCRRYSAEVSAAIDASKGGDCQECGVDDVAAICTEVLPIWSRQVSTVRLQGGEEATALTQRFSALV